MGRGGSDGATLQLNDLSFITTAGGGGKGAVLCMKERSSSGRELAVKVVRRDQIATATARQNALRERRLLCGSDRLSHPFIVEGIHSFKDSQRLFLALEYFPGGDLHGLLLERRILQPREIRFIAASVVCMLEYLHGRRVLYRDLKPENLMLTPQGYLKLIDLGLCKELGDADRSHTVCGTPIYMSPERFSTCDQGHGLPSDWWALGVMLFELVFSATPHAMAGAAGDDEELLRKILDPDFVPQLLDDVAGYPGVSPASTALMAGLMAFDPSARPDACSVRQHAFFEGQDWDALLEQRLPPLVEPGAGDDAPRPIRASTLARLAARGDSAEELLAIDAAPYDEPPGSWDEEW
jgi:serine/threonine protein kinase